jgi:hypothetical protein
MRAMLGGRRLDFVQLIFSSSQTLSLSPIYLDRGQVEFGIGVQGGFTADAAGSHGTGPGATAEGNANGGADADAEERSRGGGGGALELRTWGAAAASRRRNPFLAGQGRRTYEDTINPQQVAVVVALFPNTPTHAPLAIRPRATRKRESGPRAPCEATHPLAPPPLGCMPRHFF